MHRCLNLVCLSLLLLQCRSWGKFWLAPKFSGFAPAVNPSYTVRSGFLVGSVANADGAEALEFSIDGGEFQTALGLIPFKIPLPTSSATWRLESRHKITLRLRYPNNGLSDAVTYAVRKGNNRDINGDGYPDLVVGADQYNAAQGRAYIFLSRGSDGVATQLASAANAILTGENTNDQFGVSVALDDFNGDGYADLLVGASTNSAGQGRLYIFYSTGAAGIASQLASSSGVVKIDGRVGTNANLGFSVYAGDVNGDGYADAVGGAYLDSFSTSANSGHVYIFHSAGASGISSNTAATASTDLTGENNGSRFGNAVALGDFNGDGYADLVVGAPFYSTNTGRVFVFNSSATGIASQSAALGTTITGVATAISLGNSVATGDFNGDGYTDIASGAHGTGGNIGAAFLFLSKPNFTSGTTSLANYTIGGEAASNYLGFSVAFADTNGDGYQDWYIHAQQTPTGGSKAYMFHSLAGALSDLNPLNAPTRITGENDTDFLGAFSGSYDLNADGYDDLILGAYQYISAANTGRVYIYLSPGPAGVASGAAANAPTIITGEAANTRFGRSMPF